MSEKIKVTVTVSRECAAQVNSAITGFLGAWVDPEEMEDYPDCVDAELERVGEVFEAASVNNKAITKRT